MSLSNVHMINDMFKMQEKINMLIDPDWREKEHEWYRAIWVECAELMDHYGYKWWKKQDKDLEQVKLELIDIWHFGLSHMLQYKLDDIEKVAEFVEMGRVRLKSQTFRDLLEDFVYYTLENSGFHVKRFIRLCDIVGLDFEELYHLYMCKNTLNVLRQKHGYKEGTYKKIWLGREDNEVLMDIYNVMCESGDVDYFYLYDKMEQIYLSL